jgi:hypothetical protein
MLGDDCAVTDASDSCGDEIVVTGTRPQPKPKSRIIRSIVNALNTMATWVRPPDARRPGESFDQCVQRVAGSADLAVAGAAAAASGANIVPYPRGVPPGGGGTSIISTLSRALFSGLPRMGTFKVAGTNSVGGAIGRVASRGAVLGGTAAVSLKAGKVLGALQVCDE